MFDNVEEYVGVDDEAMYIATETAHPIANPPPCDENDVLVAVEGGFRLEAD